MLLAVRGVRFRVRDDTRTIIAFLQHHMGASMGYLDSTVYIHGMYPVVITWVMHNRLDCSYHYVDI